MQNWSEEQLNIGIAIMAVLTVLALMAIGLIWVQPSMLAPVGLARRPPTPTPRPVATLPPTWTPTATPTQTPTPTATPTETPLPTGTAEAVATETAIAIEGTPTPDLVATLTALPTDTPIPFPTSPPPPPPRTSGGGGGSSAPPVPTPTPMPLYIVVNSLGGVRCDEMKFFGYVYNNNGTPRPGVTVRVFNEFGYQQDAVTQADGYWEVYLGPGPAPERAGTWHLVLLEDGQRASDEIAFVMPRDCSGVTVVRVDWQRTLP
ncbi:MAG: hypothetical protein D6802_00960 [Ardenticatenia bacterium]|nr:MAG: hypothetical protein D6802_00960 [Ardenticatenia bacterium]